MASAFALLDTSETSDGNRMVRGALSRSSVVRGALGPFLTIFLLVQSIRGWGVSSMLVVGVLVYERMVRGRQRPPVPERRRPSRRATASGVLRVFVGGSDYHFSLVLSLPRILESFVSGANNEHT